MKKSELIEAKEVFLVQNKIHEMNYPTVDELWKVVKDKIKDRELFDAIINHLLEQRRITIDLKERVM